MPESFFFLMARPWFLKNRTAEKSDEISEFQATYIIYPNKLVFLEYFGQR